MFQNYFFKFSRVLVCLGVMLTSFYCKDFSKTDNESHLDTAASLDQNISNKFQSYWYSGKAELNRYKLRQARYGEIHEGNAVLIFVTEDVLADSQVKYEGGDVDEDINSVLKMNFTKTFNTGIYPYSMMSSVFTSIENPLNTLKITTSSQEWCGHTFTQLNHRRDTYDVELFSYFMNEGDQSISINDVLLEDEIWNIIRLDPNMLPIGELSLLPGTQFLRLKHLELKPQKAKISINKQRIDSLSTDVQVYRIDYQEINRLLEITFEADFPYSIISWSETTDAGFGREGNLTTTAIRTHVINEPYWQQHSVSDSIMRTKLGLD